MGTNYYLIVKKPYNENDKLCKYQEDSCVSVLKNGYVYNEFYYPTIEDMNKDYEYKLHIGKSSYGWHFLLCTYPELNINNLNDWKKLFESNKIEDEYGDEITCNNMIITITCRSRQGWDESKKDEYEKECMQTLNSSMGWLGSHYDTYDDFLNENSAERGFNGLLKHKSFGYRKITNDGGTYDLTYDWDFS